MKRLLTLLLLLSPFSSRAADQDPGPYKFFAQFVGGTWVSQTFEYKPGHMGRQESIYTWCDGKRGIRGDLYLYEGTVLITHESDLIAWNPVDKKFNVLGTDTLGNVKQVTSWVEDGVLVSELTASLADGKRGKVRGRLTVDGDSIDAKIFREGFGSSQVQALELHMKRRP
jgi:hypothetical protein